MARREGGSKHVETYVDDARRMELRRRCCTSLLYWRSLGRARTDAGTVPRVRMCGVSRPLGRRQRVLATALANAGRYRGPAFC
jgi:hypothetical protein